MPHLVHVVHGPPLTPETSGQSDNRVDTGHKVRDEKWGPFTDFFGHLHCQEWMSGRSRLIMISDWHSREPPPCFINSLLACLSVPSHPVSHSDRKDNSSWCPTEDVLQYTNTKRTNTNIYKRYTLFVVTCLSILDGEMNSTEIQMTIQRSASWATIVKLPHFKCQLSVLFNLPAGLNPQVNNRLNIFSFWQKGSSKHVKGHWQKII